MTLHPSTTLSGTSPPRTTFEIWPMLRGPTPTTTQGRPTPSMRPWTTSDDSSSTTSPATTTIPSAQRRLPLLAAGTNRIDPTVRTRPKREERRRPRRRDGNRRRPRQKNTRPPTTRASTAAVTDVAAGTHRRRSQVFLEQEVQRLAPEVRLSRDGHEVPRSRVLHVRHGGHERGRIGAGAGRSL